MKATIKLNEYIGGQTVSFAPFVACKPICKVFKIVGGADRQVLAVLNRSADNYGDKYLHDQDNGNP